MSLAASACRWGRVPELPVPVPIPGGGKAVDVHTHIFNATDLAIEGFAKRVVLQGGFGFLEGPIKALDYSLGFGSKDYASEKRLLDHLFSGEEAAAAELQQIEPPTDLIDRFVEDMEREDRRSLIRIYDEQNVELGVEASGALRGTVVDRALRWGWLLTRYRVQIAERMLNMYPEVQLFTPSMVDMDCWLEDRAATSVAQQAELYDLIVRWSRGRIHPFVAYDPYRELRDGGALDDVKRAITKQGCVGVKLYPPMGFRPWENAELFEETDIRRGLDGALESLYSWCEENDVAIMAHCNASNGSDVRYGDRADPFFWGLVLQRHPQLRLNLGHFGGSDDLRQNASASWAWHSVRLMTLYPNVYADTAYHGVALGASPGVVAGFFRQLDRLRREEPVLGQRLLYGSDWQMIMMAPGWERYRETYVDLARAHWGDASARQYMGDNALRYLGLDVDSASRRRLVDYYVRHGIPWPPVWASA